MCDNIRHNLNPVLVKEQIDKKISELTLQKASCVAFAQSTMDSYDKDVAQGRSHLWPKPPPNPSAITDFYEDMVGHQLSHYALVRIIELPKEGNRFILVYGNADDATVSSGTGPFATLQEAEGWFYRGGR